MATLYAYSPNGTQATLSYSVIGFTQSLQQNGWCKLPNGLILQWGKGPNRSTLPLTFPNKGLCGTGCSSSSGYNIYTSISKTQIVFQNGSNNNSWVCFGY